MPDGGRPLVRARPSRLQARLRVPRRLARFRFRFRISIVTVLAVGFGALVLAAVAGVLAIGLLERFAQHRRSPARQGRVRDRSHGDAGKPPSGAGTGPGRLPRQPHHHGRPRPGGPRADVGLSDRRHGRYAAGTQHRLHEYRLRRAARHAFVRGTGDRAGELVGRSPGARADGRGARADATLLGRARLVASRAIDVDQPARAGASERTIPRLHRFDRHGQRSVALHHVDGGPAAGEQLHPVWRRLRAGASRARAGCDSRAPFANPCRASTRSTIPCSPRSGIRRCAANCRSR